MARRRNNRTIKVRQTTSKGGNTTKIHTTSARNNTRKNKR